MFQDCVVNRGVLERGKLGRHWTFRVLYGKCTSKGNPTLTGGACYFKSGYLTPSLPGRVHMGNVTNVEQGTFIYDPVWIIYRQSSVKTPL